MLKLFVEFLPIYLFIFEIIFLIALRNRAHNAARIADGNHICRNILCYNTASADNRIIANGYTRNYNNARADPAVFADCTSALY